MSTPVRLFLSYAREDEVRIENVYRELCDEGFQPWMDTKDLLPGENWESSIRKAIHASEFFLVFFSANSVNKRGFVQKEIKLAFDVWDQMLQNDIYLIPIRLDVCEVPEKLKHLNYLDLFKGDSWPLLLKAIHAGMSRRIDGLSAPIQVHTPSESVSWWEVQLRSILCLELDSTIHMLGGVEPYIKVLIDESPSRPKAQAAFHEALRNVVQSWQTSKVDTQSYTACLLDLILVFIPSSGFVKVFSFLQQQPDLFMIERSETKNVSDSDLALKSLMVLGMYYPIAPPFEDSAFRAYTSLLRDCLLRPRYKAYAVRRLVELNGLEAEDQEFRDLVTSDPNTLDDLLSLFLAPIRRASMEQDLSKIYRHCLMGGKELALRFEQAVAANGGSFVPGPDGPMVHIRSARVPISLSGHDLDKYAKYSLWSFERKGFEHLYPLSDWIG
jgi:hypothetical protein